MIEKNIFQSWYTTELNPLLQNKINSYIEMNPEYKYQLYTDNDIDNFVNQNFKGDISDCYNKLNIIVSKVDFWRYLILYKYGGVYLDFDSSIDKPLRELINNEDEAIITAEGNPGIYVQWGLIFKKNHPILERTIKLIVNNIKNNLYSNNIMYMTGPHVFTKAIYEIHYELFNNFDVNQNYVNKNTNISYKKDNISYRIYGIDFNGYFSFKHQYSYLLYENKKDWMQEENEKPLLKNISLKIIYGSSTNNIDVTDICYTKLLKKDTITIPSGDHEKASYFGDPHFGVLKSIFIIDEKNNRKEYKHHLVIQINIFDEEIYIPNKIELDNTSEFRNDSGIVYPPFSKMYFEKYFYNYMKELNNPKLFNRYIPVFWTELQISSYYNKDKLHSMINNLDENMNYFTIVQHDDGINISLPKNITLFGMGGNGHVPIPLTYENEELFEQYKNTDKTIFCSFIGSITHDCRKRMIECLKDKNDVIIQTDNWTNQIEKSKQDNFLSITSSSRFTLCPRGYGRTSFRLYECFKLKSIPIYIYDECFLPYMEILDWSKMAVLIHIDQINQLYDKIKSITDEDIQEMFNYYDKYSYLFSYKGMADYILQKI